MPDRILLVHGRSFKPAQATLRELWLAALRAGLSRTVPQHLPAFDAAETRLAYFGNHSNDLLRSRGRTYDEPADVVDRRNALADLERYADHQFTKRQYRAVPGVNSLKELFADVVSGPLNWFHLSEPAIAAVAPDLRHYWNPDDSFGSDVRWPFTVELRNAFDAGDRVLVLAHSLGSMIAWDTFWKFSHYGEYRDYRDEQVDLFLTIGCPLGDATVKEHLKGARADGSRRYPNIVRAWINVSAEDDYIAHDERIANDYRSMKRLTDTETIRDVEIYNLAVRHGDSNPHASVGYLIHPKVATILGDWLGAG